MKNLLSLLERFSKALNKDSEVKETIARVVAEKSRVKLSAGNFSLKEGVLAVSASAVAKNEMRLKEESIKKELAELHRIFIIRILYK